jgi:hypothetical protein
MLRPTKHSHPDRTIINVAFVILVRLKSQRAQDYRGLRIHIKKAVAGGDVLFMPALYLLFVLGLIRYHQKTDSIELRDRNAPV